MGRDYAPAAMSLLKIILCPGLADQCFYRLSQTEHLRAQFNLLLESPEIAAKILEALLALEKEKGRNRELMWVRLTLAAIWRKMGKRRSKVKKGLPIVVESALEKARDGGWEGARVLIRQTGVRWICKRHLWIWSGGPAADTAWGSRRLPIFNRLAFEMKRRLDFAHRLLSPAGHGDEY